MASSQDILTLRRRIGDPLKANSDVALGDGHTTRYLMRYSNLSNVLVQVNDVNVLESTYVEDDIGGSITFNTAPDDAAVLGFSYNYSAYSDADAGALIDQYGLDQATIEALMGILADAARLYNYSKGSSTSSKSQVFTNIEALVKMYQTQFSDVGGDGEITVGQRTALDQLHIVLPDLSRQDYGV
jgi:hypothetical protein